MKIKKGFLIFSIILILLNCYGCYKPSNDTFSRIENNTDNKSGEEINAIVKLDYNDDDLNINWGYGCKLDGVVYTIYHDRLRYYENGTFKKICRDPLCDHSELTCASSLAISFNLVATDGEKLYCFGHHFEKNPNYQKDIEAGRKPEKEMYIMHDAIYEIDTETQKIRVLTKWEQTGMMIPLLRVDKDYVYYLIVTSESKSDLYRVNKRGGESELVSKNNNGQIIDFVIGDMVFYRKGNNYYKTDINLQEASLFIDAVTVFLTLKDNYIYYAIGARKSYDCIGSDNKVSLYAADIYRIKLDDINDMTKAELLVTDAGLPDAFIITKNKIVYLPQEPVYKGKITLQGVDGMIDLYNYCNGKVMTLDLNTLEKKVVCTEMIDGYLQMNYADDNQAFFYNNEKQKIYRLDINTEKLTELETEK